jgi:hypothetical protein
MIFFNQNRIQMRIQGLIAVEVIDDDHVAIPVSGVLNHNHFSAGSSKDQVVFIGCKINPIM